MGISTFQEIINETQASRMRVGRKLLEKGNIGARYEKNTVYILREKMTSVDKCIFAVATQLCRRWVVPKHNSTDALLKRIIDNDYHTLSMYNDRFRDNLYGLIRTSWILNDSTVPDEYKESYCRFGKKIYDPTNLKGVDNKKGRKLINGWEMIFRVQNLLIENYLGEPISDSSVGCLDSDDKSITVKIGDIISGMSKSFWSNYKELLSEFNDIYGRFRRSGHDMDDRDIAGTSKDPKKELNVVTHLDAEVFYQRCKSEGVDDESIKSYFDRVKKLDNVKIVGISKDNKHLQNLIGEEMKKVVV